MSCVKCGVATELPSVYFYGSGDGSVVRNEICLECVHKYKCENNVVYGHLNAKFCAAPSGKESICDKKCKNTKWSYVATSPNNDVYIFWLTCSRKCYYKKRDEINETILTSEKDLSKYRTCARCRKIAWGMKKCGGCRNVWYCDEECQKKRLE